MLSSLFVCVLAMASPLVSPESQGVASQTLIDWIGELEKFEYIHGFVVRRHGAVIAEGSWKPFDTLNERHMLYSHSKSFTSTAIGFLVDDGKLDLDERVAEILSDKAPPEELRSENLRALRVRDLLTMNSGNSNDENVMTPEGDWVKAFLASDFDVRPGTQFRYSTVSTHILSAIVERKSGMRLMDFLKLRLFDKIGIAGAWSTRSPAGVDVGGSGMRMTTFDLSLFGQFLLQEGKWNGEQLLSKEWVRLATGRQTWSRGIFMQQLTEKGGDWEQGYGFQFWRCRHDAYRADGACGQLTLVVPKQELVVSVHSGTGGFQKLLDTIWNIVLPALKDHALPENPVDCNRLRERCKGLEIAPVGGIDGDAAAYCGKTFVFGENPRGFRQVRLDERDGQWRLALQVRGEERVFDVGRGRWLEGKCVIDPEPEVELLGRINGEQTVRSSGALQSDGSVLIRGFLTETPSRLTFRFGETNGAQRVWLDFWSMGGCKAEACPGN